MRTCQFPCVVGDDEDVSTNSHQATGMTKLIEQILASHSFGQWGVTINSSAKFRISINASIFCEIKDYTIHLIYN